MSLGYDQHDLKSLSCIPSKSAVAPSDFSDRNNEHNDQPGIEIWLVFEARSAKVSGNVGQNLHLQTRD